MDENRGHGAPTAADLGLPETPALPDSESLHSDGSRPGSANSRHSLAALSTTDHGELDKGHLGGCILFSKKKRNI